MPVVAHYSKARSALLVIIGYCGCNLYSANW